MQSDQIKEALLPDLQQLWVACGQNKQRWQLVLQALLRGYQPQRENSDDQATLDALCNIAAAIAIETTEQADESSALLSPKIVDRKLKKHVKKYITNISKDPSSIGMFTENEAAPVSMVIRGFIIAISYWELQQLSTYNAKRLNYFDLAGLIIGASSSMQAFFYGKEFFDKFNTNDALGLTILAWLEGILGYCFTFPLMARFTAMELNDLRRQDSLFKANIRFLSRGVEGFGKLITILSSTNNAYLSYEKITIKPLFYSVLPSTVIAAYLGNHNVLHNVLQKPLQHLSMVGQPVTKTKKMQQKLISRLQQAKEIISQMSHHDRHQFFMQYFHAAEGVKQDKSRQLNLLVNLSLADEHAPAMQPNKKCHSQLNLLNATKSVAFVSSAYAYTTIIKQGHSSAAWQANMVAAILPENIYHFANIMPTFFEALGWCYGLTGNLVNGIIGSMALNNLLETLRRYRHGSCQFGSVIIASLAAIVTIPQFDVALDNPFDLLGDFGLAEPWALAAVGLVVSYYSVSSFYDYIKLRRINIESYDKQYQLLNTAQKHALTKLEQQIFTDEIDAQTNYFKSIAPSQCQRVYKDLRLNTVDINQVNFFDHVQNAEDQAQSLPYSLC